MQVGRGAEMDALAAVAASALAGAPTVVLVQGEAGIGKSRLVSEFAARQRAEGWLVLSGRCVEVSGSELPLAPIAELVRDAIRQLGVAAVRELVGRWRDALATLVSVLAGEDARIEEVDRASVFDAVLALLSRLADERPLVVLLEDMHWADASTRDLVAYLTRTRMAGRTVLVLTRRDEAADERADVFLAELLRLPEVEQLTLEPLSSDLVAQQMEDITGEPPSPGELARVVALSDGIPFLVEEVLAADRWTTGLPDRVRRIVTTRLVGLSGQARRAVDAASLADAELTDTLLRRVIAQTDIDADQALHEAVQAGVLVPVGDRYRFRHAMTRIAVADAMLTGQRRQWHERWAQALTAAGTPLEPLTVQIASAQHWDAAGEPARALTACLAAADECRRRQHSLERAHLMCRALGAWDGVEDAEGQTGLTRNQLVDETADALTDAGDWPNLETMLRTELSRPEVRADELRQFVVRNGILGARSWSGAEAVDASAFADNVPAVRSAPASRDKVTALIDLCWGLTYTDLELGGTLAREALEVAEALGDETLIRKARIERANQGCFSGRYREALTTYDDLRGFIACEGYGTEGYAQMFMLWALLGVGDAASAKVEAETIRARLGSYAAAPFAWSNVAHAYAEILMVLGEWDRAQAALDEARSESFPPVDAPASTVLDTLRGLIATWRGDTATAQPLVAAAEEAARTPHVMTWEYPLWLRAESALAGGRPTDVRELLRDLWARPGLASAADVVRRLLVAAARAEAELSRYARALRDDTALAVSEAHVGAIQRVWTTLPPGGVVGAAVQIELDAELSRCAALPDPGAWVEAVTAWRELEFPYELGYAAFRLAEAYLDRGEPADRERAVESLVEADELARRLTAKPLLSQIASLARRARINLDAQPPPSQPDDSDVDPRAATASRLGLTDRELEVLSYLIEGYGNIEIGKALFMSPKTASVHVSRILTKLGASNRTQAATIGHRLGLVSARPEPNGGRLLLDIEVPG